VFLSKFVVGLVTYFGDCGIGMYYLTNNSHTFNIYSNLLASTNISIGYIDISKFQDNSQIPDLQKIKKKFISIFCENLNEYYELFRCYNNWSSYNCSIWADNLVSTDSIDSIKIITNQIYNKDFIYNNLNKKNNINYLTNSQILEEEVYEYE
jgi:hypothetical protein